MDLKSLCGSHLYTDADQKITDAAAGKFCFKRPSCIHDPVLTTRFFYKKLGIWGSTESFFKISASVLRVSYEFLKGSITFSMFATCSLLNIPKLSSLKPCQCLVIKKFFLLRVVP